MSEQLLTVYISKMKNHAAKSEYFIILKSMQYTLSIHHMVRFEL